MTSFTRIIGPKADVAELEYVAALHQTCNRTRNTGTISSLDICRYLKSLHSLEISHAQARDIIQALGGGMACRDVRVHLAEQAANERQEQVQREQQMTTSQRWRSLSPRKLKRDTGKDRKKDNIFGVAANDVEEDSMNAVVDHSSPSLRPEEIDQTQRLLEEILSPKLLYLDIVQMTSILFIPTLTRMAKEWSIQHPEKVSRPYASELERLQTRLGKMYEGSASSGRSTHPPQSSNEVKMPADDETQNQGSAEDSTSVLQSVDLLEMVLHSMWRVIRDKIPTSFPGNTTAAAGNTDAPTVTEKFVQTLLMEFGEVERANDPDLIRRMVQVATPARNDEGQGVEEGFSRLFDEAAFIRALTMDLYDWDVGCEDRQTTTVHDVFGNDTLKSFDREVGQGYSRRMTVTEEEKHDKALPPEQEGEGKKQKDMEATKIPEDSNKSTQGDGQYGCSSDIPEDLVQMAEMRSIKALDTVIDAYGSTTTLVLAWVTFIGQTGTYAVLLLQLDVFSGECEEETFGCILGKTIVNWIVLALVSTIFGFIALIPLSYGNHPTWRGPARMLLATSLVLVVTIVPFVILLSHAKENMDAESTPDIRQRFFAGTLYLTTFLGILLAVNYFLHFMIALAQERGYALPEGKWVEMFTTTSHAVGTARCKRAATRKINSLLANARSMHGATEALTAAAARPTQVNVSFPSSASDTVLQNYILRGDGIERIGSLFWVWENIRNGSLFDAEGIWLPARLVIFQFAQIAVAILSLFLLYFIVDEAARAADEATATLENDLPAWIYDLVPTGAEVRGALIPAASISVAVCFFLILIYVPSTVKMVLKYRCGQYAALGDENFQLARASPDLAYNNISNAIYGMVAACFLFFFLFGLTLFLFLWDFSKDFAMLVLAWGIGLTITIWIWMLFTACNRQRFFRAFYRILPVRANITGLAMECCAIGLGGGVLIGRVTQFLLAAAFWIGRIDEPFLADHISIRGYRFDYVPAHYAKDVLLHEAHRHPYIERLGAMYLMRLRYKSFANSNACACWRHLFILTLLPWLMKYRVSHKQRCMESIEDQESESDIKTEEDREALTAVVEDIMGAAMDFAGLVEQRNKTMGRAGIGEGTGAEARLLKKSGATTK